MLPNPLRSPTVLMAWTETLLRALDAHGFDGGRLAASAGITAEQLTDPDHRISLDVSRRLWAAAVEVTGDDAIGVEVSRYIRPSSFHVMSHAFLSSPTVSAALDRAARYTRVTADIAVGSMSRTDDEVVFELGWADADERPAWAAVDAALASVVRTIRFLLGPEIAPTAVALERPTPGHPGTFGHFFRCPVTFGAPTSRLVFDRRVADRRIPGGNDQLAAASDRAVAAYLGRLGADTLSGRLRLVLVDLVAHDPDISVAARELAVSPRILQRKLADEGTTYRQVLAEVRRELADVLLGSGLSVTETGLRLGFSETAAFSRAYRRWTGTAPSGRRLRP